MSDGSVRINIALDTKEFVQGITGLSTIAKSGLEKLESVIKSNTAVLDTLENKQKSLTKQIELQKNAMLDQSKAIESSRQKYSEIANALDQWNTKLKSTKQSLEEQKTVLATSSKETELLRIKYKELNDSVGKNADETKRAGEAYKESKQVLSDQRKIVSDLESEYKTLNNGYKENAKNVNTSEKEAKNLSATYDKQQKILNTLETELKETNGAIGQQKDFLTKATSGWALYQVSLSDVVGKLEKTSVTLKSVGDTISTIGGKMAIGITAPIVLMGKSMLTTGMAFESSLSDIKAVSGATVEEMKLLSDASIEAGASTKFSAQESAIAIEELIKAGITPTQVLSGALMDALDLASAGVLSVKESAEIAATVLNTFSSEMITLGEASNVLAGGANASATDVLALKQSLSAVGTVAAGTGVAFKDTVTALSLFAQNGLLGSDAGTSLKTMLMRLQPVTKKQGEAFASLGLLTEEGTSRFYDMNGAMRPLGEVAGILQSSMQDLTVAERNLALGVMFGTDAIRGANILYKEGSKGFDEMAIAMSQFTVADVAATRMDNLAGRVEEVTGKFETFTIKLFEAQKGAFSSIVSKIDELVTWLLELDSATLQTGVAIAMLVAVAAPVLIVFGKMISVLGTLASMGATVVQALAVVGTGLASTSVAANTLAGAMTFLTSSAFIVPATIVAITVALAKFTPLGDKAYAILVGLVAGFVAFKTVAIVQSIITGITLAMSGQVIATNLSTISLVAYNIATTGLAIAQGIASVAVLAFNTVVAIVTGQIALSTVAMQLFNLVMLALPIGWLIGAVVGLVAALAFLVIKFNEQSEATKATVLATDELIAKTNELSESVATGSSAYDENIATMDIQSQLTSDLADEVLTLAETYATTGEGMGLLQTKIDLLNSTVPNLALSFNDETNALNLSTEAILDKVTAQEKQVELNEQLGEQQRLKEEEIRIEKELTEIQLARAEIEKTLSESGNLNRANRRALTEQTEKLTEAEETLNGSLETNSSKQKTLNPLILANAESMEKLKKANADSEIAIALESEATEEQIKIKKRAEEVYGEYVEAILDGNKEIRIDQYRTSDDMAMSFESIRGEMLGTMATNNDLTAEWEKNMKELSGMNFDPRFIQTMKDAGVEGLEVVKAWVDSTDTDMIALNKSYEDGTITATNTMKTVLGLPENTTAGAKMIDEMAESVDENRAFIDSAVKQVTDTKLAMSAQVKTENFEGVGSDMALGVATGITSGTSKVTSSATKLINMALTAMRDTAENKSPSKKTIEIAHDMGDGLVVGSEDKEQEVGEAGGDIATAYLDSLTDGFDLGLSEASVIMLGGWEDVNQGMTEIIEKSGLERVQAEINTLDETISAIERKSAEILKAEEITAKERKIIEAKSGDERIKAQDELNKTLAKNELDALKERRAVLKEQLKEVVDVYNSMSNAIVSALKEQYTQQRDTAIGAMEEEMTARKDSLDRTTELHRESLESQLSAQSDALSKSVEMQKDALDSQISAQKDATASIIEQYEREYDAKMDSLNWSENSEVNTLQQQIDSIDEKTTAEERALKVQENQRKLHDLQTLIDQAETDEARLIAQEKFDVESSKQQREALLLARKDEKDSLKTQINAIKESYKSQKDLAKEDLAYRKEQAKLEETVQLESLAKQKQALENDYKERKQALDNSYKDNKQALENDYKERKEALNKFQEENKTAINGHYNSLTSKERLEAEARKMMIDGDQQAIIQLLNKYTPDWARAGQSAGESFLNALQGVTPSIESEVNRIMDLINRANSMSNELSSQSSGQSGSSGSSSQSQGGGGGTQQSEPKQYTVKSGDTLSGIANNHGVSVSSLRSENGLRAEDDKRLQVGKKLRIPIMHDGGISTKEQFALIDEQEAVIPMLDLVKMMERAVVSTANSLVHGFSKTIQNIANTTTNNNDNGLSFSMNYYGDGSRAEAYDVGREFADQTAREIRGRGLTIIGG